MCILCTYLAHSSPDPECLVTVGAHSFSVSMSLQLFEPWFLLSFLELSLG